MNLNEAVEAVEARKQAVFGDELGEEFILLQRAPSTDHDRAIFSGYDLDYDELRSLLHNMASALCGITCRVGLYDTFMAGLAEALHIGLVKGADSRS